MTIVEGQPDLSGNPVWWVVTDTDVIPFQGEHGKAQAMQYMRADALSA